MELLQCTMVHLLCRQGKLAWWYRMVHLKAYGRMREGAISGAARLQVPMQPGRTGQVSSDDQAPRCGKPLPCLYNHPQNKLNCHIVRAPHGLKVINFRWMDGWKDFAWIYRGPAPCGRKQRHPYKEALLAAVHSG